MGPVVERWKAFELSREYLATAAFRFLDPAANDDELRTIHAQIRAGEDVDLRSQYAILAMAAE